MSFHTFQAMFLRSRPDYEIVQLLSREMIGRLDVEIDKESRNAGNQEVTLAMVCVTVASLRFLNSCFPAFLKLFRLEVLLIPQLKSWTVALGGGLYRKDGAKVKMGFLGRGIAKWKAIAAMSRYEGFPRTSSMSFQPIPVDCRSVRR